jgi:iron complex outermembrane recepter protein
MKGETMSTHSKLLGSVSLLATALAVFQGASAQDQSMETVVVTGIRAAIVQGLENKRESNVIVESIAAEDIGKMPDANLAEALQRVPGVAIDRDGGEGRYVSIRGLGPDFNTVMLNGRRIATSEYTRSFAFDTLSSDIVGGMNVYKTQQSFIREGGVGGTVDVRTLRPMQHMGFHASGRLEFNHENNSGQTVPQGSFLVSDTFLNDTLGVLVSGSYQERRNRTFNVGTDRIITSGTFAAAVPNTTAVPAAVRGFYYGDVPAAWGGYSDYGISPVYGLQDLNRSVTDERRQRIGTTVSIQWRPNDDMEFNVDYLYSAFNVVSNTKTVGNWLWNLMPPASTASWIRNNWAYYDATGTKASCWCNSDAFADYVAANSHTTLDSNGVVTHANTMTGMGEQFFNGAINKRPTVTQSLGMNFVWNVSNKLKLTVDAAISGADNNNPGISERRSLTHSNIGEFDYYNTNGIPYTTVVPGLTASATDNQLFMGNQYNYGTDISATNKELSLDAEYHPVDSWTFRAGALYEVAQKRSWYYRTPQTVNCLGGTIAAGCHISDAHIIYNNAWYSTAVPLTQSQVTSLIHGVYSPDPKDFGMSSAADVKTLLINYAAIDSYVGDTSNIANASFVGLGYTSAQKADAIATYQAYAADHGGNAVNAAKTGEGYIVSEKVTSLYANAINQGTILDRPYVLTLGLRYAHTETHTIGYTKVPTALTRVSTDNTSPYYSVLNVTFATGDGPDGQWVPNTTALTANNSYDNFLPDIDFRVDLSDHLVWRVGASQSLSRPQLDLLAPYYSIESQISAGNNTIDAHNPYLKPVLSTNFDTAAEWYYGEGNAITFDAYWKSIKGLMAWSTQTGLTIPTITTGAGLATFSENMPTNAKSVRVYGATIGWTHTFELGIGWQVNYTWTGTDWNFNPNTWSTTDVTLPGLSNNLNAVLFYEGHGFGVRVAYNWRAKFLSQTNFPNGNFRTIANTGTEPVFGKSFQTVDARIGYAVLNNAEIYIEGTNLLNAPVVRVGRFDNLLVDRNNYGSNIVVGYSMKF